jgi:hypothetical protein
MRCSANRDDAHTPADSPLTHLHHIYTHSNIREKESMQGLEVYHCRCQKRTPDGFDPDLDVARSKAMLLDENRSWHDKRKASSSHGFLWAAGKAHSAVILRRTPYYDKKGGHEWQPKVGGGGCNRKCFFLSSLAVFQPHPLLPDGIHQLASVDLVAFKFLEAY